MNPAVAISRLTRRAGKRSES